MVCSWRFEKGVIEIVLGASRSAVENLKEGAIRVVREPHWVQLDISVGATELLGARLCMH